MLTVSDFFAKHEHFVVTFDTDKAVVTTILAEVAATVVREPIFLICLVLPTVAVLAAVGTAVGGSP